MARKRKETKPRPRRMRWECRRCLVQWVTEISPDTPPGRTDEFERTICEGCVDAMAERLNAGRR